jgi:hypothetical protein
VLGRLTPRGIAFRFHQVLDPVFQSRPVGVHLFLLDRADIVDVDIDGEAVQIGMENVERRAAFQGDAPADQRVGAEGIENVEQPDHPLQRRGLELPLGRDVLEGFSRRDHQTPSKAASTACAGRSTRHGSTSTA